MTRRTSELGRAKFWIMLVVATLGALFALGPTPTTQVNETTFNPSSDLSELEKAVAKTEGTHLDITPGAEKTFV
ncbi:MAG: hypothetical protein ACPGQI_08950, partial [Gammaproteobacteria bacterium]